MEARTVNIRQENGADLSFAIILLGQRHCLARIADGARRRIRPQCLKQVAGRKDDLIFGVAGPNL